MEITKQNKTDSQSKGVSHQFIADFRDIFHVLSSGKMPRCEESLRILPPRGQNYEKNTKFICYLSVTTVLEWARRHVGTDPSSIRLAIPPERNQAGLFRCSVFIYKHLHRQISPNSLKSESGNLFDTAPEKANVKRGAKKVKKSP